MSKARRFLRKCVSCGKLKSKNEMIKIAPSILSADFMHLYDEVKSVSDAEFIHCDVMDAKFVPNLTFGPCVIKNMKRDFPNKIIDVHLMISDPIKYALEFAKNGADYITFHYEALKNAMDGVNAIREMGVKVGVSIKPNTDVNVIEDLLPYLDLVLVMSVEPGFGGQEFMDLSLPKIRRLKELKEKNDYSFLIEVDGGMNYDTARLVKDSGAEVLVVGSFLFGKENRNEVIKK